MFRPLISNAWCHFRVLSIRYRFPVPQCSRQFTDSSNESVEEYLSRIGIRPQFHNDILQSTKQVLGAETIAITSFSQAFSESDLLDLSKAIENQQKKRRRKRQRPTREVLFRALNAESTLTWRYGESLLDLAKSIAGQQLLGDLEQMEGPCGGKMNCSTCHIYLDSQTYKALPPPVEEELDMLDLAFEPKETSRLGCQVKFDPSLAEPLDANHKIIVTLPPGVNDEWVE